MKIFPKRKDQEKKNNTVISLKVKLKIKNDKTGLSFFLFSLTPFPGNGAKILVILGLHNTQN